MTANSCFLLTWVTVVILSSGVSPEFYYNITTKGDGCVLPFYYNGVNYTGCVNDGNGSKAWCSTTDNYTRDRQRGDCLDYDVCVSHNTVSSPWRNTEFNLSAITGAPMDDSYLPEGWYRFAGIGGDSLVYSCFSLALGESSFYTCEMVIDSPKTLNCSGGLVLYYLVPINGTYLTRHSSCNAMSCGPHAVCNDGGGCRCTSTLSTPVGFWWDSYTCTESIPLVTNECKIRCSEDCALDLLENIQKNSAQAMSKDVVAEYLNEEMKCLSALEDGEPMEMGCRGNNILNSTEKLVSRLVMWTWTNYTVSIILPLIEVQVFVVGPNTSLTDIPQLRTTNASLDIDLIGISQNNSGFAAVAFLSYAHLFNLLNPSFSNKPDGRDKVIVSNVVSVVLFNISIEKICKPFNITLKKTTDVDPNATVTCMNWKETEWMQDLCRVVSINNSHIQCSCAQPGTFALIMLIKCSSKVSKNYLYIFNLVGISIGLGFLGLTLLTFACCRNHLKVNSVAQVNLTISLLLAHLLFLLTQKFLRKIRDMKWACQVLAGVLHFLFLSAFMWMLIDAVVLFISAKNLTKIRSGKEEGLHRKSLAVIGYVTPLAVVGVSAGIMPGGYGTEQCWISMKKGFFWSFLGPVCAILALNLILFGAVVIMVIYTLKSLNSEILQRRNTLADKKVIRSVMLKTIAQFFILGCPWILGFFTCENEVLEFLFLFFNSQQGTFIFFIYCILNKEIREQYKKWSRAFCSPKKKP